MRSNWKSASPQNVSSQIDTVLIGDDLPTFRAEMIATMTTLDVNELTFLLQKQIKFGERLHAQKHKKQAHEHQFPKKHQREQQKLQLEAYQLSNRNETDTTLAHNHKVRKDH